jgi:hypothetical protein
MTNADPLNRQPVKTSDMNFLIAVLLYTSTPMTNTTDSRRDREFTYSLGTTIPDVASQHGRQNVLVRWSPIHDVTLVSYNQDDDIRAVRWLGEFVAAWTRAAAAI